jgi:YVTN family beta-propeller protein
VIDTSTDRVVRDIEVGKAPHGLALTPDGKLAAVTVYGGDAVAVIDTARNEVIGSIPVAKPHNIAIHPDGKTAYVASQEPGKFALVVVDLQQRSVLRSVPLDKTPRALEFGPDGRMLYFTQAGVNAIVVLDPTHDQVVAQIPVGASPHYAHFTRAGQSGLAVSQGPNELTVFSPASNTVGKVIGVGKLPHWVTASGDGRFAYVSNEGSNDVSIVDLASGKVSTVAVGNAPRKIVVQQMQSPARGARSVGIANFAFLPAALTIVAGETVTWVNQDAAPHAVQAKDGPPSDLLAPGTSYSRRFDKAGEFDYVCSVHPYMTGKVVVRAPSSARY